MIAEGPRPVILWPPKLARSYTTIGVLGADSCIYPSASWGTENQHRYRVLKFSSEARDDPKTMVTSLDTRRHNPHSSKVYHIHRIHKQPVCTVATWMSPEEQITEETESIYRTAFQKRTPTEPRTLVLRQSKEKKAEGIVPFNLPAQGLDIRSEMLLPVCDSTRIPSAPNPHRYLLRKRKVPPPLESSGVLYPDDYRPYTKGGHSESADQSRKQRHQKTCISSLCGKEFTRRRFIPPRMDSLAVGSFDGGAKAIESLRMHDNCLPLVKVPDII